MHAVDEQRKYGEEQFIIYKKMDKNLIMSAPQDEKEIHYSTGIPSKYPGDYELFKTFSSFSKMKNWIVVGLLLCPKILILLLILFRSYL